MVYFLCKAYDSDRQNCYFALSLPVRGAWIEIWRRASKSTRGAWIEMLRQRDGDGGDLSRSPCGEHGLKLKGQENP